MSVYYIFLISESGSLRFFYEHTNPDVRVDRQFDFPVPMRLANRNGFVCIDFGATEGLRNGYVLLKVNGMSTNGLLLSDGREVLPYLQDPANFPVDICFGVAPLSPNDCIQLSGMFQALHGMTRVVGPLTNTPASSDDKAVDERRSRGSENTKIQPSIWNSGVQTLDMPNCRLHCLESRVGVKFLMLTDMRVPSAGRKSLNRVYEAYVNAVLKNPFCDPNQAIKLDSFIGEIKGICDQVERGIYTVS